MDIPQWTIDFLNGLSPNLDEIYVQMDGRTLASFKTIKLLETTSSGAVLSAIPVAGYATIPADILHLFRVLSVTSYGIGAIMVRENRLDNILEQEDFTVILGRWAKIEELQDVALAKWASQQATKVGSKAVAHKFANQALKHAGALVGRRVAKKVGVKVAGRMAKHIGAKLSTRWIPFISAAVGGGSNLFLCYEIATEAEKWYKFKIDNA